MKPTRIDLDKSRALKTVEKAKLAEVAAFTVTFRFQAKDLWGTTGLSYRQLNDWETKGIFASERTSEEGWRRFDAKKLFSLAINKELHDRFGLPAKSMKWLNAQMLRKGSPDYFMSTCRDIITTGQPVWLMTDLKEVLFLGPALELEKQSAYFLEDKGRSFILLEVNPLINRILATSLIRIYKLESNPEKFNPVIEARQTAQASNMNEFRLLQLVRRKDLQTVTVKLKDGTIEIMEADREIPESDYIWDKNLIWETIQDSNFQTITIKVGDKKILRVQQKTLLKVAGKET